MNIIQLFVNVLGFIDHILVPLIFAIAFVVFLWGLMQGFIFSAGNDEKLKEGKKLALWGFIGLVLMISVWGIVNLLINSLGFGNMNRPNLPTFNGQGGANGQGSNNGTLVNIGVGQNGVQVQAGQGLGSAISDFFKNLFGGGNSNSNSNGTGGSGNGQQILY